jgi:hypothetical protein
LNKVVALSIVFLVIVIIIICLYFISKHKQQAIHVYTLESFINTQYVKDDEGKKKNILETINDFFKGDSVDGDSDDFDGYHDDDADDGGE